MEMDNAKGAVESLRKLSLALFLTYEPQDWGIVNADGARIEEFIDYWKTHPDLPKTLKFDLGGLILASANERLRSEPAADLSGVLAFVSRYGDEFGAHIDYWRVLVDIEEFPLGAVLRQAT